MTTMDISKTIFTLSLASATVLGMAGHKYVSRYLAEPAKAERPAPSTPAYTWEEPRITPEELDALRAYAAKVASRVAVKNEAFFRRLKARGVDFEKWDAHQWRKLPGYTHPEIYRADVPAVGFDCYGGGTYRPPQIRLRMYARDPADARMAKNRDYLGYTPRTEVHLDLFAPGCYTTRSGAASAPEDLERDYPVLRFRDIGMTGRMEKIHADAIHGVDGRSPVYYDAACSTRVAIPAELYRLRGYSPDCPSKSDRVEVLQRLGRLYGFAMREVIDGLKQQGKLE